MLGSISLAIIDALHNRDALLADFPRRHELDKIEPDQPYPLSFYLELCDYLEQRLGVYAFMRAGRRMAKVVMDTTFPPEIETIPDAIAHAQVGHESLCKPAIGKFELVESRPGFVAVRYTASFNCILQEGLFYEVALRYGAEDASVAHAECRRKGADACRFEIRYRAEG
ncbi:hypothetical protein G6O69_24620 [Pseudenhygromyxa sp. WMMC2535]|uniref:hypothetical protein n=1 Tax=Pseudenhygromyxa sp. WMMC2535 TaxID=2712867 RepID=UPI0015548EC6|nr:hypothetical protein [Pseudenhygromyxa sp. WMMC2535]NVB41048.1 hypothetical protein [Pseudenhygromyxa sp. WMMC2535]